jgi:uncharacterized protein
MITTVLRPPIVLAAGLVLAACSGTRVDTAANPPYASQVRFGAGTPVLHVAVATTDRDRQRGLMGVRSLPRDAGMAFVWTEPTTSAFWMKDTPVPLSIAFVDDGGRIVTIREMEPCRAEPCPVYRSDAPFVLAIEANRGWFDRHGVGIGDRATLERTP